MKKDSSIIIAVVLIAAVFLLIRVVDWGKQPGYEIYYNQFLASIDEEKVVDVTFRGKKIEGTLLNGQNFYTYGHYDKEIIDKLVESNVSISVEETQKKSFFYSFLVRWAPVIFLIGIWIFFLYKSSNKAGKIFSINRSNAKKFVPTKNRITFKDVAGIEESKEEVTEIVDFLKNADKFKRIGARIPKGILMVGLPGTGKTLLAKSIAGEANVPFFSISGSEFVEMFVGVGASRVRSLFEEAKKNSPCIIFIDEIDAVGRHRGAGLGSGHDEREQTLNQLLSEMDGFEVQDTIIVVAATNRADILDKALLRPGRFDRRVYIHLPDMKGRGEILKVHSRKVKLDDNVDILTIAKATPGFSGAQLANLINEAALYTAIHDRKKVDMEALEYARDKIILGKANTSIKFTKKMKEITAYREAGHAVVAVRLKNTDPIHKITIIPRGNDLGRTTFLPQKDILNLDKKKLTSSIVVSLSGKAAEDVIFNQSSTSIEKNLKHATNMAYSMVCRWGMNSKIGAVSIKEYENSQFLAMDYFQSKTVSEELRKNIDQEVKKLLTQCYEKAKKILIDNKGELDKLAHILLEKETITGDELKNIIL